MPEPEKDKRRETGLLIRVAKGGTEKVLTLVVMVLFATFLLFVGSQLGFTLKMVEGVPILVQITQVPDITDTSIVITSIPATSQPPAVTAVPFVPSATPLIVEEFITEVVCPDVPYAKWLWNMFEEPLLTDTPLGFGETYDGYGTGHVIGYLDDGSVEVGIYSDLYGYTYEDTISPSALPYGWWSNIHQFSTLDGAFALCSDDYGLYAALVPYNSFT